jgi:hypothetical protein
MPETVPATVSSPASCRNAMIRAANPVIIAKARMAYCSCLTCISPDTSGSRVVRKMSGTTVAIAKSTSCSCCGTINGAPEIIMCAQDAILLIDECPARISIFQDCVAVTVQAENATALTLPCHQNRRTALGMRYRSGLRRLETVVALAVDWLAHAGTRKRRSLSRGWSGGFTAAGCLRRPNQPSPTAETWPKETRRIEVVQGPAGGFLKPSQTPRCER